jgi:hypothetical protein
MAKTVEHILDENNHYALDVTYDSNTLQLTIKLRNADTLENRFRRNIIEALQVSLSGESATRLPANTSHDTVTFTNIDGAFSLQLGRKNRRSESIGQYEVSIDGKLHQHHVGKLVVSETRRIGSQHEALPYNTEGREDLFERAQSAVFTDYHTHSSAQISSEGLFNIGVDKKALYPLHLLAEAGIDTSIYRFPKELRQTTKRILFPPLEPQNLPAEVSCVPLSALNDEERAKLIKKMSMPTDRVGTYTDMEYGPYRFRYPLTKNKDVLRESIREVAREYQKHGVQDAEITFVGLDNPELLQTLHEVMGEIEEENRQKSLENPNFKPFHLRFLMGIPRAWSNEKIAEQLEKAKLLSKSPYISGIDFVGYEVNKTQEFKETLDQFASWVNDHAPGFVLRAHAGENDKNRSNVTEILELAEKYPNLRIRIGHAIYGMDDNALRIARKLAADPNNLRVVLELNADSNIALNNIDDVRQIPLQKALDNDIPFVVGSDGSGIYETDPKQLGMNLIFSGITKGGLEALETHQQQVMNTQRMYAKECAKKINGWDNSAGRKTFVSELVKDVQAVGNLPPYQHINDERTAILSALQDHGVELVPSGSRPAILSDKLPITIVGASGGSWDRISPQQQRETAIAMDMLAHVLDPDKVYFVQGRHKPRGLTGCMQHSIEEANTELLGAGKKPFYTHGILAEPKFNKHDSYRHLTHVEIIDGKLLDTANALVGHAHKNGGIMIAAGGAAFTRDAILEADKKDVSMFLLSGPEGASSEKAEVLNPKYRTVGATQLISKLFTHRRDLLRTDFDLSQLDALYDASKLRVEAYEQRPADADQHQILGGETLIGKGREK